jgi:hypothetical protein
MMIWAMVTRVTRFSRCERQTLHGHAYSGVLAKELKENIWHDGLQNGRKITST